MRGKCIFVLVLGGLIGLLAMPRATYAAWWWPFGTEGMDYSIVFKGEDGEVKDWLRHLKLDERDTSRTIGTDMEMQQELAARGQRVKQALDALGYYDATLLQAVRKDGEDSVLEYRINQGPRYKVGKITMQWEAEPLREIDTATLASKVGEPVNAEKIITDGVTIVDAVGKRACLLALDVQPLVKLYENKRDAELVFRITHGARANFGPTLVSGTQRVNQNVVLRHVTWKEGRCFRQRPIDETRENLVDTQLFSAVTISHSTVPDAQGEVPMAVEVRERAARTLRAGAAYSTDEGVVVTTGWENRNLWGNGEKFSANLSVGSEEQGLDTSLRLPDFYRDDQALVLTGSAKHEERDAYTADTITTGASIERKLARHWKGGVGVGFTLAKTEDVLAGNSEYALLSLPTFLEYDNRRNILDPRDGIFGNLTVTPYTETIGDGGQFIKTQGTVQTYLSAALPLSPTLALKLSGGTISGAKGDNVPSDIRFYAGGGGSVRGYGYQTLGPRVGTTTVGGASFVAGSVETRLRFTDEFGGVVFADAGNAYAESVPDIQEKLYSSVGVGVRYFTGIGPIRADIAVPLNGKDIGAAGYAVYISIGQSF